MVIESISGGIEVVEQELTAKFNPKLTRSFESFWESLFTFFFYSRKVRVWFIWFKKEEEVQVGLRMAFRPLLNSIRFISTTTKTSFLPKLNLINSNKFNLIQKRNLNNSIQQDSQQIQSDSSTIPRAEHAVISTFG